MATALSGVVTTGRPVPSAKRPRVLPAVPAMSEVIPGYAVTGWYGMIAPPGTPPAIVNKIQADVAQVLNDPKIRDSLAGDGASASLSLSRH